MNRILIQLRSAMYRDGVKRADWYRRKGIFGAIGEQVMIQSFRLPYNAKEIFIGDNVRIASDVIFITHDVVHKMLNNIPELDYTFQEKQGSINIGNNVFIGENTRILYNVTIGNNVIVWAGSVVTKALPDNTVCAGNPCRPIGSFGSFVEKRKNMNRE